MIFPYEVKHWCDTVEGGKKYLVTTLWIDILQVVE